eukprot:jgi/Chrzof1/8509/Cz03g13210.t1
MTHLNVLGFSLGFRHFDCKVEAEDHPKMGRCSCHRGQFYRRWDLAGFTKGRSTLHNLFALQHFVHRQVHCGASAYALLLDVSQAYDSVNHVRLFDVLHEHDVPSHLNRGIASLYSGLQYRIKVDDVLGPPLSVGIGVKQGCPLSPKLFNSYLADLGVHLKHVLPDAGPVLPGVEGRNPTSSMLMMCFCWSVSSRHGCNLWPM